MNEEERLQRFLNYWGGRFVARMKEELDKKYHHSPGSTGSVPYLEVGNAYSGTNPRRTEYNGRQLEGYANKRATSNLYNSISYNVVPEGVEILMLDYWEFVNYGRQEGSYVPISPLESWASLKGFDDPRGAAFGISRNIWRFGVAPTYFYDNAINSLYEEFEQDLENQFEFSLDDFFNQVLSPNNQL